MGRISTSMWSAWLSTRDNSVFEGLVRPELPALYDAARRTGLGSHDAEDIVQEALSELARDHSQRPGQVGVGAWLMRSVRLKALGRIRSKRRRRRHERRKPERAAERQGDRLEFHDEIEQALEKLGAADRQVLLFRFLYDLDYREISYVLGVSENACRIRVHRASTRMREHVGARAPTMLALMPLCDLPNTASVLATATKAAGTAGGAWAAWTGGVLMGTGLKMASSAAIAAALTAGVVLTTMDQEQPALDPNSEPVIVAESTTETAEPSLTVRERQAFETLNPTEEEIAWLKARLKEERNRRAQAHVQPSDSGIDILRRAIDHGMDPWQLMADFERFSSHVRTGEGRRETYVASGEETTKVSLAKALKEGVCVIEFGPGIFDVTGLHYLSRTKPIHSLEFIGAGMNKTTLNMARHEELLVTEELSNLRFRDLTLDYGTECELLDVRDATAAILERVRIRNWGTGAGYSAAIGVAGMAYLGCTDCEFEHTEGCGGGFAADFRGPGVAVFERCVFRDIRSTVLGDQNAKGSQVLFNGCTFTDSALTDSRIGTRDGTSSLEIRVKSSSATYGGTEWTQEYRRERWGTQFAAEIRDTTIEPSQNSCTSADLVAALQLLDLPSNEVVHHVSVMRFMEGEISALSLNAHVSGKRQTKTYTCLLKDGEWIVRVNPRGGGYGYHLADEHNPQELTTLLAAVPPDYQIRSAVLQMVGTAKEPVPGLYVKDDHGSKTLPVIIHAETGKVLTPR